MCQFFRSADCRHPEVIILHCTLWKEKPSVSFYFTPVLQGQMGVRVYLSQSIENAGCGRLENIESIQLMTVAIICQ